MFKSLFKRKAEIIKNTDPDRIYVENIRSFFNLPYGVAKKLCDMAVRQNFFYKKYGLYCKNDDCKRIISVYDNIEDIPNQIECFICQANEKEKYSFDKNELEIVEFYQLIER
ncbi:hypothetical protein [Flavobacterium sp.]|uniref:hypothetical protein n=1 Tax=Flavobacterium sp. TaxID=239 RepID=UPI0033416124